MDTPESPTQSPQSPEEEEKGLSDSELLDSADEDEDRVISDSEIVNEENGGLVEEEEEEAVESRGRGSELEEEGEEEDEVVPDFVSDPEDEEPLEEGGAVGQEDETILLMEGDEDGPQGRCLDGEEDEEGEDEEDRVIDTPQSPDSEPERGKGFINEEDGEEREEEGRDRYRDYRKEALAGPAGGAAEVDDEHEENYKNKAGEEEEEERRAEEEERERKRRVVAVREMKIDSASVSRELDEHELDYDEEVPEEPSVQTHEEEEDEEDAKPEGKEEEESGDKSSISKKKEKKLILPPSPSDKDLRKAEDSKGLDRMRRDSFRDKKKDEDDGEIDEGEIDVSEHTVAGSWTFFDVVASTLGFVQDLVECVDLSQRIVLSNCT